MFVLLLAFAAAAPAQTRPTTAAAVETQTVQRGKSALTPGDAGVNWQRLALAMAVVLGLIVVLRYAAGWLVPHARPGGGRGVRVLGRTPLGPRQQVLLVHVGRRVLVIGDSAGTLSPLANIDEPDEVAELLGQAAATSPTTVQGKFRAMFGRAETEFDPEQMTAADDPDKAPEPDANITAAKDEIAGLLDRMRSLTKSVGK